MVCRGCSGSHAISDIGVTKGTMAQIRNASKLSVEDQSERINLVSLDGGDILVITESPFKEGKNFITDYIIGGTKGENVQTNVIYNSKERKFSNEEISLKGGIYNQLIIQNRVI